VIFALNPPESVVRNDDHRDAIASRGSATNRAVAHEDVGKIRVDLKLNNTAIALAFGHEIFLHTGPIQTLDPDRNSVAK
jgi:hypothetical protein